MGGSVANVRRASFGLRILADIWRRIRLVRATPIFSRACAGFIAVLALSCGGGSAPSAPTPSTPSVCAGTPGAACFGTNNYIEYVPGDLPVVVSVPHGGALAPPTIPDRTVGTSVTDSNTIELGRAISAAFTTRSGRAPHLVIVHLRRTKLDANREVVEGAQGRSEAITAWNEYHAFIEQAMAAVRQRAGTGFYGDLHGHGHAIPRLELGYLLTAAALNANNADLDSGNAALSSSLRLIAQSSSLPSSALLRGPTSLGGLLEPAVASVPSPSMPSPVADEYFNGGYSTSRHTTTLPGLQIECHFTGVRDSATSRAAFSDVLVRAIATFAQTHLGQVF